MSPLLQLFSSFISGAPLRLVPVESSCDGALSHALHNRLNTNGLDWGDNKERDGQFEGGGDGCQS